MQTKVLTYLAVNVPTNWPREMTELYTLTVFQAAMSGRATSPGRALRLLCNPGATAVPQYQGTVLCAVQVRRLELVPAPEAGRPDPARYTAGITRAPHPFTLAWRDRRAAGF